MRNAPKQTPKQSPKQTPLTARQREDLHKAKRTAAWVGLILPLAVVAAATVLLIVWIPRMPDPAATHWGFTGGPDGFGSPTTYVWLNLGVGAGLTLMMWLMSAPSGIKPGASPVWTWNQRFLAAFTAGFAVFIATANIGSAALQLDLEDAAEAPGVGGVIGIGFGLWALVSVAAWFVQPKVYVREGMSEIGELSESSEALALTKPEKVVWIGEVRPSKAFLWVMGGSILLVAAGVVLMFWMPADPVSRWIVVGALLLLIALGATSLWFKVRIDAAGLEARSIVGWPVFRLPAEDVKSVRAAQIAPFAEFGGWGMRWTPGRFGIVMRTGQGVIATRKDGRIFAITVDDAETAAAVFASVVKGAAK